MFTRWLSFPLLLVTGYFLYLMYQTGENYLIVILPAFLALAVLYVMGPQINFWWSRMRPPALEKPAIRFISQHHRFYNALTPEQQEKFRNRVVLIRMAKDFKSQAADEMPEEIKIVLAANLAHLTFGLDDFLLPAYETVVIYPGAFPSPEYPEVFHASETFDEDGVFLFAAQQVLLSFTQPTDYYNLCLHELAVGFIRSNPDLPWPGTDEFSWSAINGISGFTRHHIEQWINRPDIEKLAVMVVHFLEYPTDFLKAFPSEYDQLRECLHQN